MVVLTPAVTPAEKTVIRMSQEYKRSQSSTSREGQLVAEMEKTAGEVAAHYVNTRNEEFTIIQIFGCYVDLSIKGQECEVWMLEMNFKSQKTKLVKGTEILGLEDATNRIIGQFLT